MPKLPGAVGESASLPVVPVPLVLVPHHIDEAFQG
jgi:hypothetical protein